MSQQDNFAGGFFLGALLGGVVGGILGTVLSSKLANEDLAALSPEEKADKLKKKVIKAATPADMEVARRKLEGKIAQLNEAIDDVRQQLGSVNGAPANVEKKPSTSHEV
jgi:S-adenosylhomocysteine hydrolase